MLILTVVAALALVGLLVISFIPQKKDGQADEGVTQTITDGIDANLYGLFPLGN